MNIYVRRQKDMKKYKYIVEEYVKFNERYTRYSYYFTTMKEVEEELYEVFHTKNNIVRITISELKENNHYKVLKHHWKKDDVWK